MVGRGAERCFESVDGGECSILVGTPGVAAGEL